MNELELNLYKKKVTLKECCDLLGIEVEDAEYNLETCSSCSIWHKPKELKNDLDGNPICRVCEKFYGM